MKSPSSARRLQIATWNIAAINNNPFEYWITYEGNRKYEEIMGKVEDFIVNPGDKDVPVPQVFTPAMMDRLEQRFQTIGWNSVRSYWDTDFSKRTIVEGFMKDTTLGSKRLASMPDRITNTINLKNGGAVFRPTVINMYEDDLNDQDMWWKKWEKFMFDDVVEGTKESKIPYQMLQTIKRSKYPDVTEQEEIDSLPLQTMCGAIFDAILVHMMNTISPPAEWQTLKRSMVKALNKQKVAKTLDILEKQYMGSSDIITLQEVSLSLIEQARKGPLGKQYHVLAPEKVDPSRDQNSVICLSRKTFPKGMEREISDLVENAFPEGVKVPVATGDILAVTATGADGAKYVVASFHGDTNGLATKPVLDAIVAAMSKNGLSEYSLIFGLDANTYEHAKPGKQQDVVEWGEHYLSHGLTSCWGDKPQPSNYTTYNARTYLQPQLNKACKKDEKRQNGDVNPKDFILFTKSAFQVVKTWKDNTGKREYTEDMAFPTLDFPSDHGILATIIEKI